MATAPSAPPPPTPTRPFPWRFFLSALCVVGAGAAGVYISDRAFFAPQREKDLKIQELEKQKKELETFVARLKYTERRARILVLDQEETPDGPRTKLRFVEIDNEGNPIAKEKDLILTGKEVYFDCLAIKFEDEYVEKGDALRGKALLLFRRAFTNSQRPEEGLPLDERGSQPDIYAAKEAPTEFERDLWERFWEYSNDPKLAKEKGVRAIHGDAPYIRPAKNMVYVLELRATGEITIRPVK